MLRLTAALALLASAALAVFLFSQVRSASLAGRVGRDLDSRLTIFGTRDDPLPPLTADDLLRFPSVHIASLDGSLCFLSFPETDPEAIGLRMESRVVVDLRVLRLRTPACVLEGFSLTSGGRRYPVGRSFAAFYGILTLTAAAPIFLWSAGAIPVVLMSRKPRRVD